MYKEIREVLPFILVLSPIPTMQNMHLLNAKLYRSKLGF